MTPHTYMYPKVTPVHRPTPGLSASGPVAPPAPRAS